MMDNLTPEAERRLVLKYLGLTEGMLDDYRRLPPEEALWRIQHEVNVQIDWTERRAEFIRMETIVTPVAELPEATEVVTPRPMSSRTGITGERMA